MKSRIAVCLLFLLTCWCSAQQANVDEWNEGFDAATLDTSNWERFSFEGPSGAIIDVKDGALHLRGIENARAGVRTTHAFTSDRFIVEAKISEPPVGFRQPTGFATLTVLFDTSGRNRIEWILRSDGGLEAWYVKDSKGERLDNKRMGTKESSPTLGIVRRGDTLMFVLNGEIGIQKTIKEMPREFHVMLYGYGTSQSNWDSVRVVTAK